MYSDNNEEKEIQGPAKKNVMKRSVCCTVPIVLQSSKPLQVVKE